MKKFTLAATILAVSASFAAPSFAMDNPVAKSRAKIESALNAQKGITYDRRASTIRTTTFTAQKPKQYSRSNGIIQRLFGNRPGPSGR